MSKQTSQINQTVATALMAIYAGRTVIFDEVLSQITIQYAFNNKRTGVTSYSNITDLIEKAGATHRYTGPNYTGECFYTFPEMAA